jgi:surface antigen
LAYNSSQQSSYNAQIAANRSSIGTLQARLAALNTTSSSRVLVSGTCGGGYPAKAAGPRGNWGCSYPQDNTIDNWNMLNRECVSYTAWMAYKNYGISTSGWGSAYKWINAAASRGFRVDQNPTAGSVAIRDVDWGEPGDVGHAMYVASVASSHDITVWEYNRHYDGTFDERRFDPYDYSAPVYYIHFR